MSPCWQTGLRSRRHWGEVRSWETKCEGHVSINLYPRIKVWIKTHKLRRRDLHSRSLVPFRCGYRWRHRGLVPCRETYIVILRRQLPPLWWSYGLNFREMMNCRHTVLVNWRRKVGYAYFFLLFIHIILSYTIPQHSSNILFVLSCSYIIYDVLTNDKTNPVQQSLLPYLLTKWKGERRGSFVQKPHTIN